MNIRIRMAAVMMCLAGAPAFAQHENHGGAPLSTDQIGLVDFQTSCSPALKAEPGIVVGDVVVRAA